MRRSHGYAIEKQISPNRHAVDAEFYAEPGEGPAVAIETACVIDLVLSKADLAKLDAMAVEEGTDSVPVDAEPTTKFFDLRASFVVGDQIGYCSGV